MGCEHGSLPDLSLLDLTVSQPGIDPVILLVVLCRQCHAACRRNTLSQGAAGHIDAGNVDAGMTLKHCSDVPQGSQFRLREEATLCQGRIQSRCRMPLGQHKAVTLRHVRMLWIHIQLYKIQVSQQICNGQGSAGMTGFCAVGALNDAHPHLAGSGLQPFFNRCVHEYTSIISMSHAQVRSINCCMSLGSPCWSQVSGSTRSAAAFTLGWALAGAMPTSACCSMVRSLS